MGSPVLDSKFNWFWILVAGQKAPQVIVDDTRTAASQFTALAASVGDTGPQIDAVRAQVAQQLPPDVAEHFSRVSRMFSDSMPDLNAGAGQLGDALDKLALDVEKTNYSMIIEVSAFAASAVLALLTPFTAWLVPGIVAAARLVVAQLIARLTQAALVLARLAVPGLSRILQALDKLRWLGRILGTAATEAVQEVAQEGLAQGIQVAQGHRAVNDLDGASFAAAAGMGAAMGAQIRGVADLVARQKPKVADSVVFHGVNEAAAEATVGVSAAAVTGQSLDDAWTGVVGGLFTGSAGRLFHSGQDALGRVLGVEGPRSGAGAGTLLSGGFASLEKSTGGRTGSSDGFGGDEKAVDLTKSPGPAAPPPLGGAASPGGAATAGLVSTGSAATVPAPRTSGEADATSQASPVPSPRDAEPVASSSEVPGASPVTAPRASGASSPDDATNSATRSGSPSSEPLAPTVAGTSGVPGLPSPFVDVSQISAGDDSSGIDARQPEQVPTAADAAAARTASSPGAALPGAVGGEAGLDPSSSTAQPSPQTSPGEAPTTGSGGTTPTAAAAAAGQPVDLTPAHSADLGPQAPAPGPAADGVDGNSGASPHTAPESSGAAGRPSTSALPAHAASPQDSVQSSVPGHETTQASTGTRPSGPTDGSVSTTATANLLHETRVGPAGSESVVAAAVPAPPAATAAIPGTAETPRPRAGGILGGSGQRSWDVEPAGKPLDGRLLTVVEAPAPTRGADPLATQHGEPRPGSGRSAGSLVARTLAPEADSTQREPVGAAGRVLGELPVTTAEEQLREAADVPGPQRRPQNPRTPGVARGATELGLPDWTLLAPAAPVQDLQGFLNQQSPLPSPTSTAKELHTHLRSASGVLAQLLSVAEAAGVPGGLTSGRLRAELLERAEALVWQLEPDLAVALERDRMRKLPGALSGAPTVADVLPAVVLSWYGGGRAGARSTAQYLVQRIGAGVGAQTRRKQRAQAQRAAERVGRDPRGTAAMQVATRLVGSAHQTSPSVEPALTPEATAREALFDDVRALVAQVWLDGGDAAGTATQLAREFGTRRRRGLPGGAPRAGSSSTASSSRSAAASAATASAVSAQDRSAYARLLAEQDQRALVQGAATLGSLGSVREAVTSAARALVTQRFGTAVPEAVDNSGKPAEGAPRALLVVASQLLLGWAVTVPDATQGPLLTGGGRLNVDPTTLIDGADSFRTWFRAQNAVSLARLGVPAPASDSAAAKVDWAGAARALVVRGPVPESDTTFDGALAREVAGSDPQEVLEMLTRLPSVVAAGGTAAARPRPRFEDVAAEVFGEDGVELDPRSRQAVDAAVDAGMDPVLHLRILLDPAGVENSRRLQEALRDWARSPAKMQLAADHLEQETAARRQARGAALNARVDGDVQALHSLLNTRRRFVGTTFTGVPLHHPAHRWFHVALTAVVGNAVDDGADGQTTTAVEALLEAIQPVVDADVAQVVQALDPARLHTEMDWRRYLDGVTAALRSSGPGLLGERDRALSLLQRVSRQHGSYLPVDADAVDPMDPHWLPVVRELTDPVLRVWHVGGEQQAAEFARRLLVRLQQTYGFPVGSQAPASSVQERERWRQALLEAARTVRKLPSVRAEELLDQAEGRLRLTHFDPAPMGLSIAEIEAGLPVLPRELAATRSRALTEARSRQEVVRHAVASVLGDAPVASLVDVSSRDLSPAVAPGVRAQRLAEELAEVFGNPRRTAASSPPELPRSTDRDFDPTRVRSSTAWQEIVESAQSWMDGSTLSEQELDGARQAVQRMLTELDLVEPDPEPAIALGAEFLAMPSVRLMILGPSYVHPALTAVVLTRGEGRARSLARLVRAAVMDSTWVLEELRTAGAAWPGPTTPASEWNAFVLEAQRHGHRLTSTAGADAMSDAVYADWERLWRQPVQMVLSADPTMALLGGMPDLPWPDAPRDAPLMRDLMTPVMLVWYADGPVAARAAARALTNRVVATAGPELRARRAEQFASARKRLAAAGGLQRLPRAVHRAVEAEHAEPMAGGDRPQPWADAWRAHLDDVRALVWQELTQSGEKAARKLSQDLAHEFGTWPRERTVERIGLEPGPAVGMDYLDLMSLSEVSPSQFVDAMARWMHMFGSLVPAAQLRAATEVADAVLPQLSLSLPPRELALGAEDLGLPPLRPTLRAAVDDIRTMLTVVVLRQGESSVRAVARHWPNDYLQRMAEGALDNLRTGGFPWPAPTASPLQLAEHLQGFKSVDLLLDQSRRAGQTPPQLRDLLVQLDRIVEAVWAEEPHVAGTLNRSAQTVWPGAPADAPTVHEVARYLLLPIWYADGEAAARSAARVLLNRVVATAGPSVRARRAREFQAARARLTARGAVDLPTMVHSIVNADHAAPPPAVAGGRPAPWTEALRDHLDGVRALVSEELTLRGNVAARQLSRRLAQEFGTWPRTGAR